MFKKLIAMSLPKIDRYLHLPVQSGDNEILKKMNRPYTALQYIKLVEKIKKITSNLPPKKIMTELERLNKKVDKLAKAVENKK